MRIGFKICLGLMIILIVSCKEKENAMKTERSTEVSNTKLERVEPPHWWIGFKDQSLQLLVKENKIGNYLPEVNYQGISIDKVHIANSENYLFIDLVISENARSGKFDILFKDEEGNEKSHTYELKDRKKSSDEFKGFDSSDAIFLITPDRFANGDESNDVIEGLNEVKIDRQDDYARHGGDLRGIINHLNYIHDLGYTAIWPTPVLINDMYRSSYHGYAITDYYRVDPRFGTLDEYIELSSQLRTKGMKLIMDQVANHCGLEHWWMKDLPFDDWVNNQKNYEDNIDNWNHETNINSNHRRTTNQDL